MSPKPYNDKLGAIDEKINLSHLIAMKLMLTLFISAVKESHNWAAVTYISVTSAERAEQTPFSYVYLPLGMRYLHVRCIHGKRRISKKEQFLAPYFVRAKMVG